MATPEEKVDRLETRFSTLEQQVSTVATKVDMLVVESQQQREDIRKAQEKHDADMKSAREKHDAEMKELRAEIQSTLKHIQNLILASMGLIIASVVGILAIAVGVLGFLWTTAKNQSPPPVQTQTTQYQTPESNLK